MPDPSIRFKHKIRGLRQYSCHMDNTLNPKELRSFLSIFGAHEDQFSLVRVLSDTPWGDRRVFDLGV